MYFTLPVKLRVNHLSVLIDQCPLLVIPAAVGHNKQNAWPHFLDHFPLSSLTFRPHPDIELDRHIYQPLLCFVHLLYRSL